MAIGGKRSPFDNAARSRAPGPTRESASALRRDAHVRSDETAELAILKGCLRGGKDRARVLFDSLRQRTAAAKSSKLTYVIAGTASRRQASYRVVGSNSHGQQTAPPQQTVSFNDWLKIF